MNILVLTSEPVTAEQLREAISAPIDPAQNTQVMVVAPALQANALKFWMSDADDAIAHAEAVRQQTFDRLDDAGVAATGDTGESDPFKAIEDALRTFPADRIVVFTHADGEQRYREDVDAGELERRFGLPVDKA